MITYGFLANFFLRTVIDLIMYAKRIMYMYVLSFGCFLMNVC